MGAYAWYYNAGGGTYYWTPSYTMSATQFAMEVSRLIGRTISASDISVAKRQSELDAAEERSTEMIRIW